MIHTSRSRAGYRPGSGNESFPTGTALVLFGSVLLITGGIFLVEGAVALAASTASGSSLWGRIATSHFGNPALEALAGGVITTAGSVIVMGGAALIHRRRAKEKAGAVLENQLSARPRRATQRAA